MSKEEKYDLLKELENVKNEDDDSVHEEANGRSLCKESAKHRVWWVETPGQRGTHLFTFDKKKIYNLFRDYPDALTKEEKEIFDSSEPFWANFFKDRKKDGKYE